VVPSLDVLFPCLGRFFFLVYPPFLLFGLSTFSWGYNFLSFICCFSLSDLSLYIFFPSIRLNLLDFYATFPIPPSLLFNRSFPPFPSDFNYSFFLSILRLSSTSHLSLTCNYTPSFLSTSKSHPFSRIISFSLPKDTMAHQ
jgi:hypothetical protein